MNKAPAPFDVHVFVCTNQKKAGECCAPRGAEEFRKRLKDWANGNPEWRGRIRVNASGCLDQCSEGIAVAIYPQNEWLLNVDANADFERVQQEITVLMNRLPPAHES